VKAYYEARAREYDDWYLGVNQYEDRHRPGWEDELDQLRRTIEALPPLRTLRLAPLRVRGLARVPASC
jgi:hypothetical protein